ncbi:hypothetical protein VP01_4180g2 [Puccinia sorghi]|uniref:No apical meristem-associated C-terminal domain-containing protein n=1 Tax=Puccinia sorghi TaxID=27349 RepID=A0A0L6UQV5_9BASI|nr:hypothetical protein VP01_4180g2 [Puccinia sorghi]
MDLQPHFSKSGKDLGSSLISFPKPDLDKNNNTQKTPTPSEEKTNNNIPKDNKHIKKLNPQLAFVVIGTNQTKGTFWERIHTLYLEIMEKAVEQVLFSVTGKAFTLDHCWGIFHHSPKWIKHLKEATGSNKSKKKENTPTLTPDILSTPKAAPSSDACNFPVESSSQPEKQKSFESFSNDMIMGKDLTEENLLKDWQMNSISNHSCFEKQYQGEFT